MAELLLRYPDEAQRVAAAEALPTPNTFLAEAPDAATSAGMIKSYKAWKKKNAGKK